jgi:hypothetical protein
MVTRREFMKSTLSAGVDMNRITRLLNLSREYLLAKTGLR